MAAVFGISGQRDHHGFYRRRNALRTGTCVLWERFMDQIRNKFFMAPDAEITIEANPGTLYKEKLQEYRKHGVNRLSLGLQSPQNRELKILGTDTHLGRISGEFFHGKRKRDLPISILI